MSIRIQSARHKIGVSHQIERNAQAKSQSKIKLISQSKNYDKLGVLNSEIASVVDKVLAGSRLQTHDFNILQKHNFVVVEGEDYKIQAIANKEFLLGVGHYKSVYKAYHLQTNEDVALAIARERSEPEDFSVEVNKELAFAEDFHEFESMFILPHKVYVAGSSEVGILMPLAREDSLRDKMMQGTLTAIEGATFAKQLLVATALMHDKGWIHRDIKPANLLIGQEGNLKVCDFGLAKKTSRVHSAGSPGYLAPEFVAQGHEIGTNKVDSFSVGVVIYNMLCPSTKLPRAKRNSGDTRYNVAVSNLLTDLDTRIQQLANETNPDLQEEWKLNQALRGLLEIDPDKRITIRQAIDLLPNEKKLIAIFEKYKGL